jgi:uncharacterized protein YjbI with pentapeptide repeats
MESEMPTRHGYANQEEMIAAIISGRFIPSGKDLSGFDFSGVTLIGDDSTDEEFRIDFSGCNLTGANFTDSKIYGVRFQGAILDNVKFDNASLEACNFCWAKGEAVSFNGMKDNESTFNDTTFPNADMRQCTLFKSDFYGADLTGADLRGISPSRVGFRFTKLDNTFLDNGTAQAIIKGANITNTTTEGARLDEGVKVEWDSYKADCDTNLASEMAKLQDPDTRARLAIAEQMLGQKYTHRGIERVADIERRLPGQRSPEAERQALIEGDCRLAADWWAGLVREKRDGRAADSPNSRSGKITNEKIDEFRDNLFKVMSRRGSPEAYCDYDPDRILSNAFPNGVDYMDFAYIIPHKTRTSWRAYRSPKDGLAASTHDGHTKVDLRTAGETIDAAMERGRIEAERQREFAFIRDCHKLGMMIADCVAGRQGVDGVYPSLEERGKTQKLVVNTIVDNGLENLHAALKKMGLDLTYFRGDLATCKQQSDGSISMVQGWDHKATPITPSGSYSDSFERCYSDGMGFYSEKVKRDGSFVRYDADGKIHCDNSPAVRDKDGNEAWFQHGQKADAPAFAIRLESWRDERANNSPSTNPAMKP